MNFQNDYKAGEFQAQKDWYNGVEYRSKLESKTAQTLDILGMPFKYENNGYKLKNGLWYKPDFYLTDARQYVECKGKMNDTDSAKIVGLVEDESRPVLVLSYENAMLVMRNRNDRAQPVKTYTSEVLRLVECASCGTRWFLSLSNTYECPKCGKNVGSKNLKMLAIVASGQQLFEFSQEIAADKPLYKEISKKFNR